MKHVFWMAFFAALTGVVFGDGGQGTDRQKLIYGLKVVGEFLAIAFILGWVLYFLPIGR
jgi:hypothetical protein